MTSFFSHRPFLAFSALPYFTDDHSYISYCLHTIHSLYTHPHAVFNFSRFCTLLCAPVTVNTANIIYFFLIRHCTNSHSSLHIFVHHCTFVHHWTLKQALPI